MANKKFDTVSSDLIFTNPYWNYKKDKYIYPNGNVGEYFYVDSRGACLIIPVDANNTFVFIRQYRYLNKLFSIEFPGGGLTKGLSYPENAKKELIEEAGLVAEKLKIIGQFNPYNGVTNEICKVFVATGLTTIKSNPEESEEFEIIKLNENQVIEKINSNEIWDGMTLAAWALFQNSNIRKELFV
jgi:ADP-ribose pyrophosphatase